MIKFTNSRKALVSFAMLGAAFQDRYKVYTSDEMLEEVERVMEATKSKPKKEIFNGIKGLDKIESGVNQ